MTTLVISNACSFGQQTNSIVSRLVGLNESIPRVNEAIATASSGYEGVQGTQFEIGNTGDNQPPGPNLFGVQANPATPGENGQAYAYAYGQLLLEWEKFWTAASAYIAALDNGSGGFM